MTKVLKTVSCVTREQVKPGRIFGYSPDEMTMLAVDPKSMMLNDEWKGLDPDRDLTLPQVNTQDGKLSWSLADIEVYIEVTQIA